MRWGERGGDGRERFRDIGRYELEIERDRERVRWVRESQRWRKIWIGEKGGDGWERNSEMRGGEKDRETRGRTDILKEESYRRREGG